jgi:chaperonin GroEL
VKRGVIDPLKVTRSALINASSVSALLLTTSCAIVEVKKDEGGGGEDDGHGHDHEDF